MEELFKSEANIFILFAFQITCYLVYSCSPKPTITNKKLFEFYYFQEKLILTCFRAFIA